MEPSAYVAAPHWGPPAAASDPPACCGGAAVKVFGALGSAGWLTRKAV
jgi:hypothetical protein